MKKVLKNLFVAFSAAALLGAFVSCGNGDENDDVLNDPKSYENPTKPKDDPSKPDTPSEAVDTPEENKENQEGQNPVSEDEFDEIEVAELAGKETSWGDESFLKVGTDYTSKLTVGSRIYFDVKKNGEYLKFHIDNGSWGNVGVAKYYKNDGSEVTKLDEDTNNAGVWNMEGEDGVYYVTVTSDNIDKLKAGFGIHGNLVINKVVLKVKKASEAAPAQEEAEAGTSVVKKIELIKNEYAENGALQTQVKIATGFESLAIGDKVKLTMKGSADKALGHAEMMVVDTTEAANWWKMLSEKYEVEIGTSFEVSHEFTIEALPVGTGSNSMMLAINGLDGDETVNLSCTEFKLEKVAGAESTEPAPQTDPESQVTPTEPSTGNNENQGEQTESAETEEDHGLLSAAVDLAWDAGATVEASKLAEATYTSKFVVTYIANEDTDYHTFKMRVVSPEQELFEGKEEGISINRTSEKKDDLHGCSFVNAPATTANTFSYQPSAAEWAKLKAGGFNIYGHGAKITKITLEAGTEIAEPSQGNPETTPTEPETPAQGEPTTPVTEPETPAATEPTYTAVWSGEQAIDWGENGIVIDHANFPADFTAVRITYNASAGALKMAVCDPWTDISATSVSEGSIADDGAINLPTGDAQSVTIGLSADSVAGIIGQGQDGAWGGMKIYGANTITITKIEAVKN